MLQKLDGTYEEVTADTRTLTGKVGADTAARANTYEGFTAQTVTQQKIAADGSTVVEIKYTRNIHTLTVKFIDGECKTQFKISPAPSTPKPVSPQTGDESHLLMLSMLSMISLAAAMVMALPRKKRVK